MKANDIKIKCICCGKELSPIFGESSPEIAAWEEAAVDVLTPGYGSKHDYQQMIVGICDDCVDNKLEDGSIIKFKNLWEHRPCK